MRRFGRAMLSWAGLVLTIGVLSMGASLWVGIDAAQQWRDGTNIYVAGQTTQNASGLAVLGISLTMGGGLSIGLRLAQQRKAGAALADEHGS